MGLTYLLSSQCTRYRSLIVVFFHGVVKFRHILHIWCFQ